ncbi:MAG: hypothetical protein JKX87_06260 [Cycloclasticus sp.]|nr:hypothetical protein [Cycloclasticus sp.]
MSNFTVIKAFKGSTTGANCISFAKGQPVTQEQLGDDLVNVALAEKWIKKAAKPKAVKTEPVEQDELEAANAPAPETAEK